jgi:predicted HicB family RNase H-like nuclease
MKDVIIYKDFIASVSYAAEDEVFFGKIEGINDLVSFEGESTKELKQAFHDAVEDYIEICRENSKDVFKSYKGSFNVRIDPQLHRKISEMALLKGISLNQLVQTALEHELALQS